MNVVGYLPHGSDDAACSQRLAEAGFDVPALSHYAIAPVRPGLVFGFTAFTADNLRAEFKRMHPVLEKAAKEQA